MDYGFYAWMAACGFAVNAAINRYLDRYEQASSSALVGLCIGFLILVWHVRKLVNVLSHQSRTP